MVTVPVEESPPALPLAGLKFADAPDGSPDNDSPMVASPDVDEPGVKPSVALNVLVPVVRVRRLVGLPATLKS